MLAECLRECLAPLSLSLYAATFQNPSFYFFGSFLKTAMSEQRGIGVLVRVPSLSFDHCVEVSATSASLRIVMDLVAWRTHLAFHVDSGVFLRLGARRGFHLRDHWPRQTSWLLHTCSRHSTWPTWQGSKTDSQKGVQPDGIGMGSPDHGWRSCGAGHA